MTCIAMNSSSPSRLTLGALALLITVAAGPLNTGCDPDGGDTVGDSDSDSGDPSESDGDTSTTGGESSTSAATSDPSETTSGGSGDSSTGGATDTTDATSSTGETTTGATSATSSTATTDEPTTTTGVVGCEDALEPITDLQSALAVRWGDIPDDTTSGSSGSSGTGGDELDPETILVTIANHTKNTCEEPFGIGSCDGQLLWKVDFVLPPEYQQPGLYTLEELNGGQFATGPNGDIPDDCWFGGGSLFGSVLIESIDENTVVGRLCGTDPLEDFDPDGSFEASVCQ